MWPKPWEFPLVTIENATPSLEGEARRTELDMERAKWLTVEEAAYVLRTDKHTVLKAIHQGHLALFGFGKVWRIHVEALKQCQKVLQEWQPVRLKTLSRR